MSLHGAIRFVLDATTRLPRPVTIRLAGTRPTVDGAQVDLEVGMALRLLNARRAEPADGGAVADMRRRLDAQAAIFGRSRRVGAVTELLVGDDRSIRARRYDPWRDRPGRALVVYLHGGGWVLGSLDSADSICRALCLDAEVSVLSVDYRMAPEARFPAATDDALAAYRWALGHAAEMGLPPGRVMLAGDSAGGNLVLVTAMRVRDLRRSGADLEPPAFQIAFYPATDLVDESASCATFATGYGLTLAQMRWYKEQYVPVVADRDHPYASPSRASDLADLGAAYVAVAGFDPLRDEGIAYATRLQEAGNEVELVIERTLIHAFANGTGIGRTSRAAVRRATDAIRGRLDALDSTAVLD